MHYEKLENKIVPAFLLILLFHFGTSVLYFFLIFLQVKFKSSILILNVSLLTPLPNISGLNTPISKWCSISYLKGFISFVVTLLDTQPKKTNIAHKCVIILNNQKIHNLTHKYLKILTFK